MKISHHKTRPKKILQSFWLTILVLAILFLAGKGVFNMFMRVQESVSRKNDSLEELRELEGRQDFLESEIERLQTNRGQEEDLREHFGVARKGEVAVIILENEDENVKVEKDKNFLESVWNKITGFFDFK